MEKQNKITYWVLFLAVIVLLSAAIPGVGNVKANYNNTVFWNTVLTQPDLKITSDCLTEEGQTVLLGEVAEECWVGIELKSDEALRGTLSWEYVVLEQSGFLSVTLVNQQVYLSEETVLVYLVLTPTKAASELEAAMDVDILVTLNAEDGQSLSGIFRATLPKPIIEEGDDPYSNGDDTEVLPGVTPDGDDPYSNGDDTEVLPDVTPDGDDPYSNGDDTEVLPDVTPDGDDPYSNGDDTDVIPDITPGGDNTYSNEGDTDIIPDITPGDDGEGGASSGNNVYKIDNDTEIISGITTGDDGGGSADSGNEANSAGVDTQTVSGNGDETTNADNTLLFASVFSLRRSAAPLNAGKTYSNQDDTEVIPDITVDSESEDEIYSNGEDAEPLPDVTVDGTDGEAGETDSAPGEDDAGSEETGGGISSDELLEILEGVGALSGLWDSNMPLPVLGELYVNTLSSYSENGMLPVVAQIPVGSIHFALNWAGGDLPARTRYSLDGGATWFMLYFGGTIHADVIGRGELYLLLDFSYVNYCPDPLTLTANAYTLDGKYVGERSVTRYIAPSFFGIGSTQVDVVLGDESTLYFPLTSGGEGCTKTYELELLTVGETAAELNYVPVDVNLVDVDVIDNVLVLTNRDSNLCAGTYRLTIHDSFCGYFVAKSQVTFFINYAND